MTLYRHYDDDDPDEWRFQPYSLRAYYQDGNFEWLGSAITIEPLKYYAESLSYELVQWLEAPKAIEVVFTGPKGSRMIMTTAIGPRQPWLNTLLVNCQKEYQSQSIDTDVKAQSKANGRRRKLDSWRLSQVAEMEHGMERAAKR